MALVRQLAFFQNQIVSASRDKVLLVWDRATGQIVRTLTAFEVLEGVVNHPDTKKTKTKGDFKRREGWGVGVKAQVHLSPFLPLNLTAAWHVVSVGHKGVLRKWNVVTGECVQEQTPPATAEPLALRQIFYSAGAKAFMTLTYDQQLQLHSPATLEPTRQVIAHFDEILDAKFVGPEQEHVALATNAAEIRVLKAATLETTTLYGHTNMVLCLDVSGDGRFLASCGKVR